MWGEGVKISERRGALGTGEGACVPLALDGGRAEQRRPSPTLGASWASSGLGAQTKLTGGQGFWDRAGEVIYTHTPASTTF